MSTESLNEGRSINSGDTPTVLAPIPTRTQTLNEGRSINSGDTYRRGRVRAPRERSTKAGV